jgi:predicted nucleotidyltransferase
MPGTFEKHKIITRMDQSEAVEKLKRYKVLVSKYFKLHQLVMFGSYAKGSQQQDSDIDVAIVVDSIEQDFFEYAPLLWKLRREIDDRIEPVLIERNKDLSGFLQEVLKTGLVI